MADYRFIDKDPIIDLIRTEAQHWDSELKREFLEKLAEKAGVAVSTLRNWFNGDTLKPQHFTVRKVLEALDCKMKIVRRSDGSEIRGPRTNATSHANENSNRSHGRSAHA